MFQFRDVLNPDIFTLLSLINNNVRVWPQKFCFVYYIRWSLYNVQQKNLFVSKCFCVVLKHLHIRISHYGKIANGWTRLQERGYIFQTFRHSFRFDLTKALYYLTQLSLFLLFSLTFRYQHTLHTPTYSTLIREHTYSECNGRLMSQHHYGIFFCIWKSIKNYFNWKHFLGKEGKVCKLQNSKQAIQRPLCKQR